MEERDGTRASDDLFGDAESIGTFAKRLGVVRERRPLADASATVRITHALSSWWRTPSGSRDAISRATQRWLPRMNAVPPPPGAQSESNTSATAP